MLIIDMFGIRWKEMSIYSGKLLYEVVVAICRANINTTLL